MPHQVVLFSGEDAQTHFLSLCKNLEQEVAAISDEEILSCDFNEWIQYLTDTYRIFPIEIFESQIEKSMSKVKVLRSDFLYVHTHGESRTPVDGVQIRYKIPFSGDPDLLKLRPSRCIFNEFVCSGIQPSALQGLNYFFIDFEHANQELLEKRDQLESFSKKEFEDTFNRYREMIGYLNDDILTFNNRLQSVAKEALGNRKYKANAYAFIASTLKIPLTENKNAPNTKPIQLKQTPRHRPARPNQTHITHEAYISDYDYNNINNIIFLYATTMEKTARTYRRNSEEELRDHLLAALNTHYYSATGETFRKIGKTDINVEFENKAAYIGECKIWHGESLFNEAIQQVISYTTWRDIKVSVIVFNKENKAFKSILTNIQNWVNNNSKSYQQPEKNRWSCQYHLQDKDVDIQLEILVFDLYVDPTLINDIRDKK